MNNEEIKVFINITETLEDINRIPQYQITLNFINKIKTPEICNNITKKHFECEISSSHGGEYDVHSCLLGCTAV
jgi:hypothetical protein